MNQNQLETIIEPLVVSFGCYLWGIVLLPGRTSGNAALLRVYIDKEGGVTIDDCEAVSHQLSIVLDVEDLFDSNYQLEVSSPGLDRMLFTLAHYQRYIGSVVNIALRIAFEGRKNFKGRLDRLENDEIVIQVDDNEYQFPIETIHKAKIVPF